MMKTALAALFLGLGLVDAAVMRTSPRHVLARQNNREWRNADGGDTEVGFGDQKINLGSITFEEVLISVNDMCSSLTCDQSWTLEGQIVAGSSYTSYTIRIETDASFASDVDVRDVTSSFDAMIRTGDLFEGRSVRGCDRPCYNPNTCPSGCFEEYRDSTEWILPNRFALRRTAGSGTSFVNVFLSVDQNDAAGACEVILSIGSAVAGAVNAASAGAASGAFSVAALLCDL